MSSRVFCSTIIPTIGRSTLTRAVESVLAQSLDKNLCEVIVVNDSGYALEPADWQRSDRVRIITTQKRERSVARNTGAAIAHGEYLHFLDDDDWMLPNALQVLHDLTLTHEADWYCGRAQLVESGGQIVVTLDNQFAGNCFAEMMAGAWVPLQASLIRTTAFFKVGGFHPLLPATEDLHLGWRIVLRGDDVVGTDVAVCCIDRERHIPSSTDYSKALDYGRWARELILSEPGVLKRLVSSAGTSRLRGRVIRIYLISLLWNLQHQRPLTSLSRLLSMARALATGFASLVSREYWQGVLTQYKTPTIA